jgi:hypothetical protein
VTEAAFFASECSDDFEPRSCRGQGTGCRGVKYKLTGEALETS